MQITKNKIFRECCATLYYKKVTFSKVISLMFAKINLEVIYFKTSYYLTTLGSTALNGI